MLQKYSDKIRPLMGHNPWTLLPVAVACVLQTAAAAAVGAYDLPWWAVFVAGYLVSSVLAGNLMAAHHEITHNLVFGPKRPGWNRALAVGANAPLGFPLGSLFKQYHMDHHSEMGVDGSDTGIWTGVEARWVACASIPGKILLLLVFPLFFFLRPFAMAVGYTKKPDMMDVLSWIVVPAYNVAICYFAGGNLKPLAYMIMGLYWGVGLHPIAGHVISEHCMMGGDGQETHSCYDPILNWLVYNFGYHVEHHDFPNIPWNRLPQLRAIAPEFYAQLTSYPNWTQCMWQFITDPTVGQKGVMTKRASRTGGSIQVALSATSGACAAAAAIAAGMKPASDMPLLRGIGPISIN